MAPFIASPFLNLSHIRHGFFTRQGGVSEGYLASLNCNQRNDSNDNVQENRHRVVQALGGSSWVGVDQKHTSHVAFIEKPLEESIVADAIVTTTPGLVIGILTADCAPILLADRKKAIVAAIHAGWQGAFSGVIENTLTMMKEKGATDIVGAVGPCIHQASYEVGPEFHDHFYKSKVSTYMAFSDIFKEGAGDKLQFNLPKMVHGILGFHDVEADCSHNNTYTDEVRFFSYRRKTHKNEPPQGGQASAICLMKK